MRDVPPTLIDTAQLDEARRRRELSASMIDRSIVVMSLLSPLFFLLGARVMSAVLFSCGVLFFGCRQWMRSGHELRARVGLVLGADLGLVALSLEAGYAARVHYPLLSQLPLAYILFTPDERAARRGA